jgi:hypothetical protein
MKKLLLLTSACMVLAIATASAQVVTYTFRNGTEPYTGAGTYNDSAANTLAANGSVVGNNQVYSSSAYAGWITVNAIYRGLIRFDNLDAYIGSGSDVQSAVLQVRNLNPPQQDRTVTVEFYAIDPANYGWYAGTLHQAFEAETATWNWKASGATSADPGVAWAGGDGLGSPGGGGYAATPFATVNMTDAAAVYDITVPLSLVQGWIDTPTTNAGIFIRIADETNDAGNIVGLNGVKPATNESQRPALILTIPEPATWVLIAAGLTTLMVFRRRRQA